jgi:hypothetical protein
VLSSTEGLDDLGVEIRVATEHLPVAGYPAPRPLNWNPRTRTLPVSSKTPVEICERVLSFSIWKMAAVSERLPSRTSHLPPSSYWREVSGSSDCWPLVSASVSSEGLNDVPYEK